MKVQVDVGKEVMPLAMGMVCASSPSYKDHCGPEKLGESQCGRSQVRNKVA